MTEVYIDSSDTSMHEQLTVKRIFLSPCPDLPSPTLFLEEPKAALQVKGGGGDDYEVNTGTCSTSSGSTLASADIFDESKVRSK